MVVACKDDAHRAAQSSSAQRAPFSHLAFTRKAILPENEKKSTRLNASVLQSAVRIMTVGYGLLHTDV